MLQSWLASAGGVMSVQLATKGASRRAAAWAITSLPRSLPQASTAAGSSPPTSWATDSPQASGPKSLSTSCSTV